jgi:small neutral amino acid transporter SnatA (MarC family)
MHVIQILFSGSFEQIFLHVKLAALSVIGGIIIISSAIYVAVGPYSHYTVNYTLITLFDTSGHKTEATRR